MERTNSLTCFVAGARADYKKRKIIITIEAWLLQENLDLLEPVVNAARNDLSIEVTFRVPQHRMDLPEVEKTLVTAEE